MNNLNCEYFYEEPNECRKCLLLGYHYSCGSQECKEAQHEQEKENKK